jgi:Ca2+-binding EF-hand superfamily protein
MGNTVATPISGEKKTDYTTNTVFSKDEVRALWSHFHNISLGEENINKVQFKKAMLFKDSALIDRIYRVFDADDDNLISFDEFISCLSVISNKTSQEDKLKLSFKIYDYNSDNYISNSDLIAVLAATLREHNLVITRQAIEEIVGKMNIILYL